MPYEGIYGHRIPIVVELVGRLDAWFTEVLKGTRISDVTKAYVVSVLVNQAKRPKQVEGSVVMAFIGACASGRFEDHQLIGDWALWTGCVLSQHEHVIETFGRLSYLSCHRLLNGKWHVYQELADSLPTLTRDVNRILASAPRR